MSAVSEPMASRESTISESNRWEAVAKLHQAYLTGLLLYVLQKRGTGLGAELIFRTFRRQHLEKFLPGLETLGLSHLPDAVACAQFIYLANRVGGVNVEYVLESDRKAWVRYPPPRWIYEGAALCAIPREVPLAFLRAFHAYCGVSLQNPRLGFVCTMITTDGDPGLEGYFHEADHDLEPSERLRFALDEKGPPCQPDQLPALPWDGQRLVKARRNYAMQYVRIALTELQGLLGESSLAAEAAALVGMQLYDEMAVLLQVEERDAASFGRFLAEMLRGCGDDPEIEDLGGEVRVRVPRLRILGSQSASPQLDAWNGLWKGALSVHDRSLELELLSRHDRGDRDWCWSVHPARPRVSLSTGCPT